VSSAAAAAAGSTLATEMSGVLPMYMKSIKRLHKIFEAKFGHWKRYLPAHSPHFLEVDWLRKLATDLPDEFEGTSAAQLRYVLNVVAAWQG
jgi:hypothetical protein